MNPSSPSFALLIEGFLFVSAFAALTAAIIMYQVKEKSGVGILSRGFRSIARGVFFIALGIITDALISYSQISGVTVVFLASHVLKGVLFVIGTYIIVIGSKRTVERLEALMK